MITKESKRKTYNELRRALNFNKFIKYLENNRESLFQVSNARNCPIGIYLNDVIEQSNTHKVGVNKIYYSVIGRSQYNEYPEYFIKLPDEFKSFVSLFDLEGSVNILKSETKQVTGEFALRIAKLIK